MIATALIMLLAAGDMTTVCDTNVTGTTTCKTREAPPSAPNACLGKDWLFVGCSAGDRKTALAERDLRKMVTSLLAEGKCDEAVRAALTGANLPLAREVKAFCAP
ncbi:hypothetical protein [Phenylobacterium sp.]|uniref:hypothetical protein n=1 Tax=Phenylobacterium sp. TaxID=1871053 RepID=UPI002737D027|nr:hypothetical protein [Phenylobacterium sp.]MDP3869193.1 hypothetical protein [Phenylobacterium sp.]